MYKLVVKRIAMAALSKSNEALNDLSSCVKSDDYASQNTAGVIKIWTSTDSSGEVTLNISTQDEVEE